MENKLPEHIQNKIFQESEDLYNKLDELAREYDHYDFGLPMFDKQKQPIIDLLTERYQQCQQMAKALEEILVYCEESGVKRMAVENPVHMAIYHSLHTAKNALATWNEGKEPNKTDHQ